MPDEVKAQPQSAGPADPPLASADFSTGDGKTRKIHFRAKTTDEPVLRQILVQQQYNLGRLRRANELRGFLERQKATGKAPLIVDAGANIGAAAIFFASVIPDAMVVAIEPDAENFRLLDMNVAGLRVEAVRAAVSASTGAARLIDPGEGHWGYRTENLPDGVAADGAVPRVTINDIYRRHAADCFPFLVKIDIEGGEADLFSGATEWVARTPVVIVELHDWLLTRSANSRTFLQCIAQLDRDFVFLGEDVYSIANDL